MLKSLAISSIYVLDQQQALDFYVGKLGLTVKEDQDLGFMRWLTIHVPGEDREILLERPGRPSMDDKTAAQVRDLVTKGAAGGRRPDTWRGDGPARTLDPSVCDFPTYFVCQSPRSGL